MRWYWLMPLVLVVGVLFWQINRSVASEDTPAADSAHGADAGAAAGATELKTTMDKVSYGVGLDFGRGVKTNKAEFNLDLILRGVQDGLKGTKPLLTNDEFRLAMEDFRRQFMAKMVLEAQQNRAAGRAFLETNAKVEGVVTLPSGLQYQALKQGQGESPGEEQYVVVNYRGTLLDGFEFDRSGEGGLRIPLFGVIEGWREALTRMKVGDKWQLFIPPDLAYGDQVSDEIPPGSTLIFEVELLAIETATDLSEQLRQFQEQHGGGEGGLTIPEERP